PAAGARHELSLQSHRGHPGGCDRPRPVPGPAARCGGDRVCRPDGLVPGVPGGALSPGHTGRSRYRHGGGRCDIAGVPGTAPPRRPSSERSQRRHGSPGPRGEGAMLAAQSSPVSGFVFVVAVLATSVVLVTALAWASRQLLGLPVGTLRAFIAALLGFVVAYLLGRSLHAAEPGHAVAFFTVVLGIPLIVAMIVIVAAEVLVPSGTGPGPLEVIRGVRSAVARFRRYWQVSRI